MATAALRSRLKRLEDEYDRAKKRTEALVANTYDLPTVDRWPEFARLTKIRTASPTRGAYIGPFEPFPYQIELIDRINKNRNIQVLKSRQTGISELICNYMACRALTEPGFTAAVISKTERDSKKLAKRTKFMLDSIEGIGRINYLVESTEEISISGLGAINFLPASAAAGRGIPACSVLLLDEAAFIELIDEIYRAAAPALSMLGEAAKILIVSTPDFESGWFGQKWYDGLAPDWYDLVKTRDFGALQGLLDRTSGEWHRFVVHYSMHPIYNAEPNWAERTKKANKFTDAQWRSEYELEFGASGSQIYPSALVKQAEQGEYLECGKVRRTYVLGVDPNAGGSDYFVAMMVDITKPPYSVVHLYRENGRSTKYSLEHVKQMCNLFLPERLVVEQQAMGSVIAEIMTEMMPQYQIEMFNTTRPSKNIATDRVLYLLEQNQLTFPAGPIGQELRAFQRLDTGERKAAPGFHDDCVMALAFACTTIPEILPTSTIFDNL
jgi:hypothetical protein